MGSEHVNMSIVKYKTDEELAAIELFKDYSEPLLQFAYAFCVIAAIIGIPGNLVTIVALASCRRFRNATAIFIINLQMSHLIYCCMVLPMSAVTFLTRHWIYGKAMCTIYPMMKFALNGTGLFTMCAITINRYIMVCHPHFYPKLYKKKILIWSLIGTWVFGIVLFIPTVLEVWGRFDLELRVGNCTMLPDKNNFNPKTLFISIAFVVPTVFFIVCYSRIWWTVRKTVEKRNGHNPKPTKPESSDEGDSSAVEMGAVCRDPSTGESSVENDVNDTNKANVALAVTSTRQDNSSSKFIRIPLRVTKKEDKSRLPNRKDKKLATMILAIIVSFTVCHLPIMIIKILFGNYKSNTFVSVFAHLLEYSSFFISPIIYVIISREYRQAYTSLFKDGKTKIIKYFE